MLQHEAALVHPSPEPRYECRGKQRPACKVENEAGTAPQQMYARCNGPSRRLNDRECFGRSHHLSGPRRHAW
eukprot:scaffold54755_cov32-Tisochrysis_lutea.AAC.3